LRVYEPLEAFAPEERRFWRSYATSTDRPEPPDGMEWEQREGLRCAAAVPPRPPAETGANIHAYVRVRDAHAYICPWDVRLRSLLTIVDVQNTLPDGIVEAFWPKPVVDAAEAELERLRRAGARVHPHVIANPWWVPLRWFLPFTFEERELTSKPLTARYTTAMAQARRRTARSLAALRQAGAAGIIEEVESLGRWLEEFHPRSFVELDYGGIARLLGEAALQADDSVRDVAAGVAALRAGRQEEALEAYRRIAERWEPLRALQHSS
jgi:hypothetical protein